jgi:hypothetical protein
VAEGDPTQGCAGAQPRNRGMRRDRIGTPIQAISRLVEHRSIAVTKLVHRKQIRPVVESGAIAMDWPPRDG